MDVHKLSVKFFLKDPKSVDPDEVIPLFHRWIQTHRVDGLLIDVADYEHVPNSTGICLIGHEADFYLDRSEGPAGLMYARKQAFDGAEGADLAARLTAAFKHALAACGKFETDYKPASGATQGGAGARFGGGEALVVFNDRLNAPNDEATFAAVQPAVAAVAQKLYGGAKVEISRVKNHARQRLTVRIKSSGAEAAPAALLTRLG
ncbi:MAG TPA: hypothetical protein VL860_07645 [Planctomycetota bacterium]|nr:hypothetical protein [Planctomycetota bacterium]